MGKLAPTTPEAGQRQSATLEVTPRRVVGLGRGQPQERTDSSGHQGYPTAAPWKDLASCTFCAAVGLLGPERLEPTHFDHLAGLAKRTTHF